jgi:hypothetical protein
VYPDIAGGADTDVRSYLEDDLPGPGPLAALALEQKDGQRLVQAAHRSVRLAHHLLNNYDS